MEKKKYQSNIIDWSSRLHGIQAGAGNQYKAHLVGLVWFSTPSMGERMKLWWSNIGSLGETELEELTSITLLSGLKNKSRLPLISSRGTNETLILDLVNRSRTFFGGKSWLALLASSSLWWAFILIADSAKRLPVSGGESREGSRLKQTEVLQAELP